MVFDLLTLQCRNTFCSDSRFGHTPPWILHTSNKHLSWDLKMLEVAINLGHLRLGWEGV